MRAAFYEGNRHIGVGNSSSTAPGRGEVQIASAFVGLCGTDLHILDGDMDARVTLPAILGHEMSGTVTTVGDDVVDWRPGDDVVVMPLDWCGTCPACLRGFSHICYRLNFMGIDSPGALQSLWNVPQRSLVRIPSTLDLKTASLAEPTAVAVHNVRRSELQAGDKALIVGGGPIGLLIAAVASNVGAEVLVSEPSSQRRAVLEGAGLRTVDPADDLAGLIEAWTNGAGVDISFEVSGAAAGVETAVASLAARGRLALVAIHARPVPVDLFRLFWRELTIVAARVYERVDFEESLRLLSIGAIPVRSLISAVVSIEEVSAAFDQLRAGAAMKILVECRTRS